MQSLEELDEGTDYEEYDASDTNVTRTYKDSSGKNAGTTNEEHNNE